MGQDMGVPPSGSGSRASHDASKLSSPKASIPNAAELRVQNELARAFNTPIHIRPRDFLEKSLAGLFGRQPDMSGDQRKRLFGHELAAVGRISDSLMKALIGLAERDSDTRPKDGDAKQGSTRE